MELFTINFKFVINLKCTKKLKRLYHINEIEPHYKQIDWKIDEIERNKTQRESYHGNCCIS